MAERGSAVYLSGTKRQSWFYDAGPELGRPLTTVQGPDELDFVSAGFAETSAIAGPITANLFLASTAPDTAVFVQVADRDKKGNVTILQRGVLRASHRAIDFALSDYDETKPDPMDGSKPFLYRPWRPHTNPTNVEPLAVNEYLVEIWPVAHVFRPGHQLQVKIMAPSLVDSYYAYAPREIPVALNTLHFGPKTPSRITLPFVSLAGVTLGPALRCGDLWQVRCAADKR
jgi:predicted acyl esterase